MGRLFMGKPQPIEYAAIIADLEAKKNALEQTLASLRAAQELGALGQPGEASVMGSTGSSIGGAEVPDGAFHGKSMPAAIRLYLEIMRSKKTAREIADGLKKGGLESTSKFFDKIVYATLDRLRKAGDVVKIGTTWGLPAWYPALMRAGVVDSARKKPRRGRPPKSASKKPEGPKLLSAAPASASKRTRLKHEPNSLDAIDWFLRDHPGSHSSEEIKAATKIGNLRVAEMLLGRMVKRGKVAKTEDGKYRKAS
jgi:hypothetical protein